ncbi:MAG: hypothetical protein R3B47_17925 [Bacteroidia bacterium]
MSTLVSRLMPGKSDSIIGLPELGCASGFHAHRGDSQGRRNEVKARVVKIPGEKGPAVLLYRLRASVPA